MLHEPVKTRGSRKDKTLVSLKPKLSNNLAMTLGGFVMSVAGFGAWISTGGLVGLMPGLFGIMGLLWLSVGGLALLKRNKLAIIIDDSGINLPASVLRKDARRILLRREDIVMVTKHESIKGRIIQITTRSHDQVKVQARFYCELDEFISYCKSHGLPVA